MVKDWENRTIEFDQPIDGDQLVQIVHKSMDDLNLHADWDLGYGFHYDGKTGKSRSTREEAAGTIYGENPLMPILEFRVRPHIDTCETKPAYGSISFNPDYLGGKECIELFNDNIHKIYEAFEKSYKEVTASD